MIIARTLSELRAARARFTGAVGLVPTMGALHAGHLSLLNEAKNDNQAVIASIFVNPAQFGPNEDFAAYPRTLDADLQALEQAGIDVAFIPTIDDIYPAGFQTTVEVKHVSQGLEGARRPGHFKGVATVVAKLFNMTQPHRAYFGQKDAQQVVVIRRMVTDLNFPIDIAVIPTARDTDGLALSSRNRYLSEPQRRAATILYRALNAAGTAYQAGQTDPTALKTIIQHTLDTEPLAQVDYVSTADTITLQEIQSPTHTPVLASLTVRFGSTRLLDNMLLPLHLNTREGLTQTLGKT